MVYAKGRLFVTDGSPGNDVLVYSTTGALLHTITGELGADGMALSADGATLYVALAATDEISAIDTTAYTHHEFTVDSCPTYLALAAGRLFYSFGCSPGSGGVSNIDASTGGTPVSNFTNLNLPPLLVGAGSVIATAQQNLEPATVATYSAATTGVLTLTKPMSVGAPPTDLALSPTGTTLVTAGGGGDDYIEYASATLKQTAEFTTSDRPITAAISPFGAHLVGGLDGTGDLVNLYTGTKSAPVWQRFGATTAPKSWTTGASDQVLPGSLTFTPAGSQIYGLVLEASNGAVALFGSDITTAATTEHLTAASTNEVRPVTASMKLSGRGEVAFTTTSRGETTQLGSVATNSGGVAKVSFRASFNGSVRAIFEGSASHYPVAASKSFKVAAKTRLRLSGSYAKRHGVELFRKRGKAHLVAEVLPAINNRRVTGAVEYRRHGSWHSIGTIVARVGKKGTVKMGLPFSASHATERVTLRFAGDKLNTKSQTTSPKFEIT
jgi:DNA-binding beta-propeller fold protein YncE